MTTLTTMHALRDTALLLVFAAPHSLLLARGGRALVSRVVPRELFYTVYGLISSVTLLSVYALWTPLPGVVWSARGSLRTALFVAHALSWALMAASIQVYGPLRQAGIAQWWAYVRKRRFRASSLPRRGPFKFSRHPIYVAMLLMLWVTPIMTTGHLLCSIVWTGYLAVGVLHKEVRLRRTLRATWKRYAAAIPLLPGIPTLRWGPDA